MKLAITERRTRSDIAASLGHGHDASADRPFSRSPCSLFPSGEVLAVEKDDCIRRRPGSDARHHYGRNRLPNFGELRVDLGLLALRAVNERKKQDARSC